MKLVKKILRLLPLLILLYSMLFPLLTNLPFDVSNENEIYSWVNIFGGNFDTILEEFYVILMGTPFENIYNWVGDNLVSSGFINIAFGTLVYELYLSLIFLMFDFINMVFGWANKLIGKGANSVE